jgi:hypothetical protein
VYFLIRMTRMLDDRPEPGIEWGQTLAQDSVCITRPIPVHLILWSARRKDEDLSATLFAVRIAVRKDRLARIYDDSVICLIPGVILALTGWGGVCAMYLADAVLALHCLGDILAPASGIAGVYES